MNFIYVIQRMYWNYLMITLIDLIARKKQQKQQH